MEHDSGDPALLEEARPGAGGPEGYLPQEWIRDEFETEAENAVARGRRPASPDGRPGDSKANRSGGAPGELEFDSDDDVQGSVRAELARAVGATKVARYEQRLKDATRAFEAERFNDSVRILRKLADDAPTAAAVREIYGLTLYRLGRWRAAVRELEAFGVLTGSTEQYPVLADCYRALHQHDRVEELWAELKGASPGADLVTEGRIVAAGSLADRGDLKGAVRLLEQGFSFPKRPRPHHLRRAYALADAYERAGEVVRARELFQLVAREDPDFADAHRRARSLR